MDEFHSAVALAWSYQWVIACVLFSQTYSAYWSWLRPWYFLVDFWVLVPFSLPRKPFRSLIHEWIPILNASASQSPLPQWLINPSNVLTASVGPPEWVYIIPPQLILHFLIHFIPHAVVHVVFGVSNTVLRALWVLSPRTLFGSIYLVQLLAISIIPHHCYLKSHSPKLQRVTNFYLVPLQMQLH